MGLPGHPFYQVNIHEKRLAAYVARALPMFLLILTVSLLTYGVFTRHTMMMLSVAAILNVAMWLWINLTAIYGLFGAWAVQDLMTELEKENGAQQDADAESQDKVHHVIVLPNYKEEQEMLDETLENLKQAHGSASFYVVLAMEAREADARSKAEALQEKHGKSFAKISATYHPANLEETHLDGSANPEVPGKASNLKWAVSQAHRSMSADGIANLDSTVLTVADADVFFHPSYFTYVSKEFNRLKKAGLDEHKWTLYQAPQLPWRNFYDSPVVSRTWGYISSLWEFGGTSELRYGGHHMIFSAYSLPLQLAEKAQCWDGDVIAEDHHTYLKSFYYGAYKFQAANPEILWSPVKVHAVMLPAKSTSVNSSDGYWATWKERWHQATRHTQGVAEVSYAALAAWEMFATVPVYSINGAMLWKVFKVVMKPLMMHVVSTLQGIALAVVTLYWLYSGMEIQGCPNWFHWYEVDIFQGETLICGLAGAWVLTWPVVIPFTLIMAANYSFLSVCFLTPGEQAASRSLWHSADGGVKPWFGSARTTTAIIIAIDAIIFLGPIMAVYGVAAEILAYWNVLFKGNFFTYITASKALGAGATTYGSMDSTKAAAPGAEVATIKEEPAPKEAPKAEQA